MNTSLKSVICLTMICGSLLLLVISCKKESDEPETVTDVDGNVYNIVQIGSQLWFKENLNSIRYNDGANIPEITDFTGWFNITTGAYCNYDNNPDNVISYGRLYNWNAVNTRKLCPTGWHVASDEDWQRLVRFIDPDASSGFAESADGGGKLKEKGMNHWLTPNLGATDEYGFSALPGGVRLKFQDLNFTEIDRYGFWWSSTAFDDTKAWIIDMGYDYTTLYRYQSFKTNAHSVRCIKD